MHGFFIDLRLYQKARAMANPFEYEEYKKKKVAEKIEKERKSRISAVKKLPKVNRALAEKLLHQDETDDENAKKKSGKQRKKEAIRGKGTGTADNPIGDDRFKALFEDEEFQVDVDTAEYRLHHPSERQNAHLKEYQRKQESSDDDDSDDDGSSDIEMPVQVHHSYFYLLILETGSTASTSKRDQYCKVRSVW
jgi:ribosome biogenesis protein ENP2